MAGTAQNLSVADRVSFLIGEGKIYNLPIILRKHCSDAIHARENYINAV